MIHMMKLRTAQYRRHVHHTRNPATLGLSLVRLRAFFTQARALLSRRLRNIQKGKTNESGPPVLCNDSKQEPPRSLGLFLYLLLLKGMLLPETVQPFCGRHNFRLQAAACSFYSEKPLKLHGLD